MRQQTNEEGNRDVTGNSILSIPQIPNTLCGVRATMQLLLKAFAIIYPRNVIKGSTFSEEKWILPASDLACSMYFIRSFIYLLATGLRRTG
jgi:hypothetical protein